MQSQMKMGWAEGDITPKQAILLRGLFHARLSEGVMDPLTATAWAMDTGAEQLVLVSCDLILIPDRLRDAIRSHVADGLPEFDPQKVIISATHTHTGPEVIHRDLGVELGGMSTEEYLHFAAEIIAHTVKEAWESRQAGSFAYGLGQVVVGSNRRWVDDQGKAHVRFELNEDVVNTFRHIEGYEDHNLNLIATYNATGTLTGLVINVCTTAQLSEDLFVISADFWHEARILLRERYGEHLFILPQCSAAGEITPFYYEEEANNRMIQLKGRSVREEFAYRILRAVEEIVPYIAETATVNPTLKHQVEVLSVPANKLTKKDAETALQDAEYWKREYEKQRKQLKENPSLLKVPRWYVDITNAYRRMHWNKKVVTRFENQGENPVLPAEIHVFRLGDVAFATVPYEFYLDFGIQLKVRSKAIQTFIVQLTGAGSYVPSFRSIEGGAYGSVPASNPVGPEGGQFVVEYIVDTMEQLYGK